MEWAGKPYSIRIMCSVCFLAVNATFWCQNFLALNAYAIVLTGAILWVSAVGALVLKLSPVPMHLRLSVNTMLYRLLFMCRPQVVFYGADSSRWRSEMWRKVTISYTNFKFSLSVQQKNVISLHLIRYKACTSKLFPTILIIKFLCMFRRFLHFSFLICVLNIFLGQTREIGADRGD